ncbi:hypothetical protein GEU84_009215 [Fertoebacter nigrum]|uniref:Uncharacterized protein n=1 Tax=Fertoeibacter niger TaxID=2656921 RepID=A0A8X8GUG1_9RHOB|nr:hypothetical protein [Fertoeibacter niger]NUB44559.1 hypothetical protein [Fertoeibacter niger]
MGAGSDALSRAVAQAYHAFAVPAPPDLGVCTACCMDPAMERVMLAKQPRDLTLAEVQEWLGAAFSRDAPRHPVAWITPRILELLAEGLEVATGGNEVALRRLREAGFPDHWSPEQVIATGLVCMIALERHIATGAPDLDGTLCMIANSGLDIGPFLAHLDTLPGDVLADLLYTDWRGNSGLSIRRTLFWQHVPQRQAVWNWYTGPDLEARMWDAAAAGNMRALEVAECIARSAKTEPKG